MAPRPGFEPVTYGFAVCLQSSQGRTSHPQCGTSLTGLEGAGSLVGFGGELLGLVVRGVPPASELSVSASKFGIHRRNGVRSATSVMYQSFLVASQRAPSAFTASFSANGVTKLILIWRIIHGGCRPNAEPVVFDSTVPTLKQVI
jgi:hypothetical protein